MTDIKTIAECEASRMKEVTYNDLLALPSCMSWEIKNNSTHFIVEMQLDRKLKDIIRVMLEVSFPCNHHGSYSGFSIYWGKNSHDELIESNDMIF